MQMLFLAASGIHVEARNEKGVWSDGTAVSSMLDASALSVVRVTICC
jgi:hypothetical protein